MTGNKVLFEPWGLGDALIAASVLRERPAEYAIACHPGWIPILKSALPESMEARFLSVELPYTTRSRVGRLDTTGLDRVAPMSGIREVLSIRGDLRDLRAARRLFPGARMRISGWVGFVARRSSLADLPFRLGFLTVRNRYEAWATLTGIPLETIQRRYEPRRNPTLSSRRVVLHVGAQWRSRQYPHTAVLKTQLESAGCEVSIMAGPGDPLPAGIDESQVQRVIDGDLVTALREAALSVVNDSGPMHLAAFLGCRTLGLARVSNIDEWVPPGVVVMRGDRIPRGYRPDPSYTTDTTLGGWPEPELVARRVSELLESR